MKDQFYTDHPRPSRGLLLVMTLFLLGFLVWIPSIFIWNFFPGYQILVTTFTVLFILILVYSFWLLHNTVYTLSSEGVTVIFGSSISSYGWDEFSGINRRQGLFALKIGWLGMTPCVRLRNAIVIKRLNSRIPLYLTPSDPEEFLEKIRQVEPRLF